MSTLQDRIKQFEAMNGAAVRPFQSKAALNNKDSTTSSPRPSYPPVPRGQLQSKPAFPPVAPPVDLLSDPISPAASSYTVIKPTVPYVPRKPRAKSSSPSPPNLECNTSLIDLIDSKLDERQDWLKISVSIASIYLRRLATNDQSVVLATTPRTSPSTTHVFRRLRRFWVLLFQIFIVGILSAYNVIDELLQFSRS